LEICYDVAKEYPDIPVDDRYVDIMAANLVNPQVQSDFRVILAPNLYGDILTDEAAQLQGGVGTAGSGNIGDQYAMFEAIHGSAPRMVSSGRGEFANPASLMKASEMLLRHIDKVEEANILKDALIFADTTVNVLRDGTGDKGSDYTNAVLSFIASNWGKTKEF
jgi:isocitrate dehydrogenase (NAD+)